jgi:CheY-like chemotaxis protein
MPRMNDRPAASMAFMSASEIIPASATTVTSGSWRAAMNFSVTGSIALVVRSGAVPENTVSRGQRYSFGCEYGAPPAGFEPAHPAPEAGALSPELWGPGDEERVPAPRHRLDPCPRLGHDVAVHGSLARVTQALGRVLVVDDDEVIRQLIAVNLTLEGFDVATAVDGQDCLDKVRAIAPDVITLDVMMPRLDGWETAVQLRKAPETAHIKVVLITARAQEDDIARGANVGADAYLTKPFDPGEMIRVVRELAGAPPA